MSLSLGLLATPLGGLVIFDWGAASYTLLPESITLLADQKGVDQFLSQHAPSNGAYMDPRGVLVVVGVLPDRSDKSQQMGPMLGIEFATNLVQAFLLALVLLRLKPMSGMGYGAASALIGVLALVSIEVSYWTWYSFSIPLLTIGFFDASVGFFLAGMVICYQIRRQSR